MIVQDPCHLRHVQRGRRTGACCAVAVADVVELDDEGLCCGAGGAYSALQPELAGAIRDRKVAAIDRARTMSARHDRRQCQPGMHDAPLRGWSTATSVTRSTSSPRVVARAPGVAATWTVEYGQLVERLESIAEELDEMAFDALREAVAEGEVDTTC